MEIIVKKFGGSSLADNEKLYRVCKHIIKDYTPDKGVVVVVSAQGKTTDNLISEEHEITLTASQSNHDLLVSAGEQMAIAKLAMCLETLGYKAKPFLGWQVPIITDSNSGDASILDIKTHNIKKALEEGNIVIVAGFQGVDKNNMITTLGRGGSDTTAIALAAALKASKCELFKDVDGIYSKDPHKYKNVYKYDKISYDKMLEMSNNGAKVLHNKCIKIAKDNLVKIIIKSTFKDNSTGTIVEC